MARLTIKKYKNNNSKNNAYGKTYGRLVYVDTLDTSDLCRHMMKHGTIYTPDVVKGVVERFVMCFEELLLEGNKIKLDGLGTFYLSVSTEGVVNEDQFTANNVKAIRIKFIGDQSKESEYPLFQFILNFYLNYLELSKTIHIFATKDVCS